MTKEYNMTLDEAIRHCDDVANDKAGCAEDCREEHCQLAEWLIELKERREKAILKIGKWKHVRGNFLTPGGTPYYECGSCGGSGHLHGVEFPKRKVICDNCGRINIYPYESASEETSSLWEND